MTDIYKLKRISDGREFPIGGISLLIGRSPSCEIQVTGGHPSREHARISEKLEGLLVEDLHSTNGTYVNNHRLEEATLVREGDILKFGDECFSVQLQEQIDATIVMRSPLSSPAGETIVEEDEDEEDSTSFIQPYTLPPGWQDFENEGKGVLSAADIKKKEAIDRYVDNFSASFGGKKGLLLLFCTEDSVPAIKVVSSRSSKQWSFGRSQECDIVFDHPCVSKHHADIRFDGVAWEMKDSDSTNGVSLEGRKRDSLELEDDMRVKLGTVEVLVRLIK